MLNHNLIIWKVRRSYQKEYKSRISFFRKLKNMSMILMAKLSSLQNMYTYIKFISRDKIAFIQFEISYYFIINFK